MGLSDPQTLQALTLHAFGGSLRVSGIEPAPSSLKPKAITIRLPTATLSNIFGELDMHH